jgi:hypothetical protein
MNKSEIGQPPQGVRCWKCETPIELSLYGRGERWLDGAGSPMCWARGYHEPSPALCWRGESCQLNLPPETCNLCHPV